MNQALTKVTYAQPDVNEFEVITKTAKMLVTTGFLPQAIKTPEQALAIILTGRELGIGTMAALNTINVIQGKPTVSPQLMLALIERSGQLENIEIEPHNGNAVRCTMKRKGRSAHTEYFGETEAAAMQLGGKDNYKKQAQTMYRWRAVAACARVVFPDVILGLYSPDEMGANVNDDGELIEAVPLNVVPHKQPDTPAANNHEPAEPDAKATLHEAITTICKDLNAAPGESIKWTGKMLCEYATDLLDVEVKSTDELDEDQLQFLLEDLQVRLDHLGKEAANA